MWFAAATCTPPNSALDDVSEPVTATPSQPMAGARNAKRAGPRRPEAERERLAGLVDDVGECEDGGHDQDRASQLHQRRLPTRSARPGASPMTAMVIRPEISMSVPAAGSQLKWNVRLRSASPSGVRTSSPGHWKLAVHGDAGERALDRGQLRDREHRDDDEVGGVRAQDVEA